MDQSDPKLLVTTGWLAENLADSNLRVLDGSWHLPTEDRDAATEFKVSHISGAQFFDIDGISDTSSDLPHMIPSVAQFEQQISDLGISNTNQVVVYDSHGLFSAARVWWLFKVFGLENIAVLDGGLPKWIAEGHVVSSDVKVPEAGRVVAELQSELVRNAAAVLGASNSQAAQIIDARPHARFKGEVPEPRAGLRSGHIPNSVNVFFKSMLNPDGTLKANDELKATFKARGVDLGQPIITSCGSGVTASVLALALQKIGHTNHALYDGSWSEWGGLHDYPVEQG